MNAWLRVAPTAVFLGAMALAATAAVDEAGGVARTSFAEIGTLWPGDIRFTDLQGRAHAVDQWRGRLVLVNFWATWCAPCRKEIPDLAEAQKRFGAHGFQIIAPAVDDPATVRQETELLGMNYPPMIATPKTMRGLMARLGDKRGALPFSLLVAPDGRIIDRHIGAFRAKELDTLIRRNLPR